MKDMARCAKKIGFLLLKLMEICSELTKIAKKLTFLVNFFLHLDLISSGFSGFWGKAYLFHLPGGGVGVGVRIYGQNIYR